LIPIAQNHLSPFKLELALRPRHHGGIRFARRQRGSYPTAQCNAPW
jgi:hypothetical protein